MIINQFFLAWLYLLSIFIFLNVSSPFIFWMITEINLLMFICLLLTYNNGDFKKEFHDLLLFYFVIQSIASIFILSDFFFSMDLVMFNSDIMFLFAMLVKLAMFPFFFWIFKICLYLNYFGLSLMLSVQKVPFFLALFSSFSSCMIFFIILSMISGSLMILFSDNLINMLVCSSITYSFWIFYIHILSMYLFLFFFFFYGVMIFLLLKSYMFSTSSLDNKFEIMLFMFLLGLSPFSIFFFKILVVSLMSLGFGILEVFIFWLLSFLTLVGYSKFFFNSFFQNITYYNSIGVFKNMKILFYSISMIFFFLFFC